MEQNKQSTLVDPVAEISRIKRELRLAMINAETFSNALLESWAIRLERTEQCLEEQPKRLAKRIAGLVEQELINDVAG
ncbi:hypothetical protein [Endozoicomonas acroporae]|uniref:hypothetical protein n=1 Tax=Endozoicomonas acroporae TaxID=1701104 RepID=UPI0013D2C21C|nr:hypothetical protein [Endozoicomonas acroporae]